MRNAAAIPTWPRCLTGYRSGPLRCSTSEAEVKELGKAINCRAPGCDRALVSCCEQELNLRDTTRTGGLHTTPGYVRRIKRQHHSTFGADRDLSLTIW